MTEDRAGANIPFAQKGVVITDAAMAWDFANKCFQSGTLPDHIQKGSQAFAIMCKGAELGLPPFASWDLIYPTKAGKLAIMTKGALGVVQAKPTYEDYTEHLEGEGEEMKAVAIAQRKGKKPVVKEFSYEDADVAGLLKQRKNKRGEDYNGTYQSYLKDMLLSRARGRALDVAFAAELRGIPIEGIAEDIDMMVEREKGTARIERGPELPALPPGKPDPFLEALRKGEPKPEPVAVETKVVQEEAEPPPEAEEEQGGLF
jgi:hypothetical protein